MEENNDPPEYLMLAEPVIDAYSSDEEEKIKLKENTVVLHEVQKACDMKPELVHFFLHLNFNPIKNYDNTSQNETVGASIERCIFEIFRFITHIHKPSTEKEFKYNDKTMTEIKNMYLKSNPIIKWLEENDCYNWKDTPNREISKEKEYLTNNSAGSSDQLEKYGYCTIVRSLDVFEEINNPDMSDKSRKSVVIKTYFESLGNIVQPLGLINNGNCKMDFDLYVPTIDIPDGSPLIEARQCKIKARPDIIYKSLSPNIWKIMLEIYDDSHTLPENKIHPSLITPTHGDINMEAPSSPNTNKQATIHFLSQNNEKQPSGVDLNELAVQPSVYKDNKRLEVLDNDYCFAARKFAKQSLPSSCQDSHCTDQMAGQHVIHLFCQAFENSKIFGNLVNLEGNKFQREIGLFVVNEYVYFSRLDIQPDLLSCISGEKYKGKRNVAYMEKQCRKYYSTPSVTYSHFRLDITRASHRLALLIFISDQVLS